MEKSPTIIVIGASAGGVDAIRRLVAALPPDFAAAVVVVLHIGAHKSDMPWLLSRSGPLRVRHPQDGEPILAGEIYVAPPDHHLVIEPGVLRLTKGPRENWARPAIDPLFRSAAQAYGPNVIGVVLTGGLNDGTAGLFEIKSGGGTTIVQDPADATDPGMPQSALKHVAVDYCLPLRDIPVLLTELVAKREALALAAAAPVPRVTRRKEMVGEYKLDTPRAVTCPDCGGALRRTELGTLTQFRCHIGHVYTAEILVVAQFTALQWSLEAALRAMNERREICEEMADKAKGSAEDSSVAQWQAAMREATDRTGALRNLLESPWLHPDGAATPDAPQAKQSKG